MSDESAIIPEAGEQSATDAVEKAQQWYADAAPDAPMRGLLGDVLDAPSGARFAIDVVDGVLRPLNLTAAAGNLRKVAPSVPGTLPWAVKTLVRAGGAVAPYLPAPVVPLSRRLVRDLSKEFLADIAPAKLAKAVARARTSGADVAITPLLGVTPGREAAEHHREQASALLARDDINYVHVSLPMLVAPKPRWDLSAIVDEALEALSPLLRTRPLPTATATAAAGEDAEERTPTELVLDVTSRGDLDASIAVFTSLLEQEEFFGVSATLSLPAELPESYRAAEEIIAWAKDRVARGGAPAALRITNGTITAYERAEAVLNSWTLSTFSSEEEARASYLRLIQLVLSTADDAVVLTVASPLLLDHAHAVMLGEGAVRHELPAGTPQHTIAAIGADGGQVVVNVPVVRGDRLDDAAAYLTALIDDAMRPGSVLSARVGEEEASWHKAIEQYRAAVALADHPELAASPLRTQNRAEESEGAFKKPAQAADQSATGAVLGIARASMSDTSALALDEDGQSFGGALFVETAVYASTEKDGHGVRAVAFHHEAETDPAGESNREWVRSIADELRGRSYPVAPPTVIDGDEELANAVRAAYAAGEASAETPAAERSLSLLALADTLAARRRLLVEVVMAERGLTISEADMAVSFIVDLARYYAGSARELDTISGAIAEPQLLTLLIASDVSEIRELADGIFSTLAVGNAAVVHTKSESPRVLGAVVDAVHSAFPAELVSVVRTTSDDRLRELVAHPLVGEVLTLASLERTLTYRSWRDDAAVSGLVRSKNAVIVTPTADLEKAAIDIARGAFSEAGAAAGGVSLVIVVGSVARSERFTRALIDATDSLHVADPTDLGADIGMLAGVPTADERWALEELSDEERWVVKPTEISERLWTPGIRTGVETHSRFFSEPFKVPVIGIVRQSRLDGAIDVQNSLEYGDVAGLYSTDPDEVEHWLSRIEAGSLFVNRDSATALPHRQPRGGWKRSSIGTAKKSGGPNHLVSRVKWRSAERRNQSATLHLRGLDSRITALIEAAQPSLSYDEFESVRQGALSDALAWDKQFGQVTELAGLGVERNLLRYRPASVAIRAGEGAPLHWLLRTLIAGVRAKSPLTLSVAAGLPSGVREAVSEFSISVFVETAEEFSERVANTTPERVRFVGDDTTAEVDALLSTLAIDNPIGVFNDQVTTVGRIELLAYVKEQSISILNHRLGRIETVFDDVI